MNLRPYSGRESPNKIWFHERTRGDCPVEEFIGRLDNRTLTATVQLFDRTETAGPPRNLERFRHLSGQVYEFKVHRAVAVRYLAFTAAQGWVVCIAQHKAKQKALQRSIAEVQTMHDEHEGTT